MRPHRPQPNRPPCPWDSPGKNTGVDCHFLLQCMKIKSESEVSQSCPTLVTHGLQPTRLLRPWDFLGKSTGVRCHCLIQKISLVFPILLFSSISMHWSLRKAFLLLLDILWNSALKCVYLSFSPLPLGLDNFPLQPMSWIHYMHFCSVYLFNNGVVV